MTGGGLIQLVARGLCDYTTLPYIKTDTCRAFNQRDQMLFWYVDKEDGFATKEDLDTDKLFSANNVLNHVPLNMRPPVDVLVPFKVRNS
jgi:hypothetical protein